MRILYIHQYFTPLEGNGPTRSYEFARRLIAQGHEVTMLTSTSYLPEPYKSAKKVTKVDVSGIPTIVVPVPYENAMSFRRRIWAFLSFAIWSCLEAMRQSVDVIFATSAPLTVAIPGLAAHFWLGKPMVFEVRDLWPEMPIAIGAIRDPISKWLASALEWMTYHVAQHIVALSPGMAAGVIRRGIPENKVTIIPNSCDIELFNVLPSRGHAIREKLGINLEQPLIIYTGQFGMIYGVDYAVDMAYTMKTIAPDVRFLLVGKGKEQDALREKAKELGVLNENLFIWEPVPKAYIPDIMSASTVSLGLFISLKPMWNTSSNKFFDALAAAKPLAINYGGWQAELLLETGAGIVLPEDDRVQAAEDLAAFVHNPTSLKKASQVALELAMSCFDREAMAQKLETVLKNAAQG